MFFKIYRGGKNLLLSFSKIDKREKKQEIWKITEKITGNIKNAGEVKLAKIKGERERKR